MSKNQRQSNLLSFFTRPPISQKEETTESPLKTPSQNEMKPSDEVEVDMEDVEISPVKKKLNKRQHAVISSDEDEENKSEKLNESRKMVKRRNNKIDDDDDDFIVSDSEDAYTKTPAKKSVSSQSKRAPFTPLKSITSKKSNQQIGAFADSFIGSFRFDENLQTFGVEVKEKSTNLKSVVPLTPKKKDSVEDEELERFTHLDFEFLKPEKVRDANKRRISDLDYDPKTLYVPPDFMQQQTPGHKQWWLLKSEHFDTILFFKVGKFYELYHMDAVIAVEALNLTYMRGKYAHCGFPEIGYSRFADQLINRGYKVARVEQTETPKQLEERCRKTNVKDKVVRREICRLTTAATRTYGILEGTDNRDTDGVVESEASYLMAITERPYVNDENEKCELSNYGVCFVDCTTGQFYLSQFNDDNNNTTLRTLLAHNYPSQLLFEKSALSQKTTSLLTTTLCDVPQQGLFSDNEFYNAEKTLEVLSDEVYFGKDIDNWPEIIKNDGILSLQSDFSTLKPNPEFSLALSALGAIAWYLKDCLIDVELLTMKLFNKYLPTNLANKTKNIPSNNLFWSKRKMVLDGTSLLNLHVLPAHVLSAASANVSRRVRANQNTSFDSTLGKFSLLNTVNKCVTGFGKRQLQRWLCTPSCDSKELSNRQKAVYVLMEAESHGSGFVGRATDLLRKIPDLERLFQRIHTLGLKYRAENHPDGRAQLFESDRYNQRKIKDLVLALDGLSFVQKLSKLYLNENLSEKSDLLELCLGENFPEMSSDLEHFSKAFNRNRALENGVIVPNSGVDAEFDKSTDDVENCERELESYLESQKSKLRCSSIKYFGTGKNSYQMEIPDAVCAKISSDYSLLSQRKGFKRFSTEELDDLKIQLNEARNCLNSVSAEVTRRVFNDFDNRKNKWSVIVKSVGTFDCILSLVRYAQTSGLKMCCPEFVFNAPEPFLEIRSGYHPSLVSSLTSSSGTTDTSAINYIPNDCLLGMSDENEGIELKTGPSTMLLTGANMGGKSTLMRQVSSLVILAQIGSMVPAERMRLSPVDRIFCRIGANDRLSAGQSTFFVELAETNIILREATKNSLVLIDELGRGTSTHDGTAIAFAVLKHIANKINCRTIFSTHYHTICEMIDSVNESNLNAEVDVDLLKNVKLAHMACVVDNENTEDPTEENITFLYTLASGPASKSYGFYTAKVAGIDVEVVRRAFAASNMLKSL